MNLEDANKRAMQVRELYEHYEQKLYGRTWSREELALGFIGDIGDLMKLLQGKAGVRQISDLDDKLAHELADCLWCVLVLAKLYDVDIETAFIKTMDELEFLLKTRLTSE